MALTAEAIGKIKEMIISGRVRPGELGDRLGLRAAGTLLSVL